MDENSKICYLSPSNPIRIPTLKKVNRYQICDSLECFYEESLKTINKKQH